MEYNDAEYITECIEDSETFTRLELREYEDWLAAVDAVPVTYQWEN